MAMGGRGDGVVVVVVGVLLLRGFDGCPKGVSNLDLVYQTMMGDRRHRIMPLLRRRHPHHHHHHHRDKVRPAPFLLFMETDTAVESSHLKVPIFLTRKAKVVRVFRLACPLFISSSVHPPPTTACTILFFSSFFLSVPTAPASSSSSSTIISISTSTAAR